MTDTKWQAEQVWEGMVSWDTVEGIKLRGNLATEDTFPLSLIGALITLKGSHVRIVLEVIKDRE